ncbi:uncharacterized protein SAPINGB_P006374 [Magnusiomyces paraingens]|uniref:Transmembrane 9 superfamily member n=1 Tax=Magnusiomyces paraingens TaxID=2606893 RepID=A0A5E8C9S0_9ASCO|nr:uncharacterized protein SAPINGB_P006374 [Saprochaete ingens]VVT58768.1 unnamed protein product [Saprochaete ingens]
MLNLTVLFVLASVCRAFYLPGVSPTDYEADQRVPLLVNSLTPSYSSQSRNVKSIIPYDYYNKNFNFCKPSEGPKHQSESLGSILFGDRIFNSPFELYMLRNESCKQLCSSTYTAQQAVFVNRKIRQEYNLNWLIDGLPAGTETLDGNEIYYSLGFPLGQVTEDRVPILNTHYNIIVEYHTTRAGKHRVVGVSVDPYSERNKPAEDGSITCGSEEAVELTVTDDTQVVFTYSVTWVPSSTVWATRWDKYLHVFNPSIQWFSLANSIISVLFLTGMVATILLRTLRKDIARYNEIDLTEEIQEDSGWKLVHGDVFRSPKNRMLLSVFLGSGAQLFFMGGATLVFALLGFLSPSNRGSLTTVMIVFYTFFGFVGGYVSARFYKTFGGEAFKLNAILTPILVPGIVFSVFVLLNFFLIFAHSSGAVPFGTMLALIAIWFVISIPLSALGSFLGFKREAFSFPVRTNQIPRQIPTQPKSLRLVPSVLFAGILPFCAIFIEVYYIYNSLWFHKVYYMFGFLFVCCLLMIMTTATVTVLLTYFLLCAENYHWQWRAFFAAGACSVYILLQAVVYLVFKLSLGGFISNVLYIGYSVLLSFVVFVLTGSIGFIVAFFFVRKIYGSIKID